MKNAENHVAEYLRHVAEIHSSGAGVAETSYYPPLQKLFNDIGGTLKPKVRCIIQLKNQGAGFPDGGLFTLDQIPRHRDREIDFTSTLPDRGVLEVKSAGESLEKTADGDQVDKYFLRYRQVLVTNLWDFILVGQDAVGNKSCLERFRLAENEAGFWTKARNPKASATARGQAFAEYLLRVFLHAAPLAKPQDVARFLASYAKEAKYRLEEKPLPALESLRTALEEALGISFATTKAESFFRSTLIQTLFYGIFSAWVMWSKENSPADSAARFDWRVAAWTLHVPMIGALFEQVISPTKLRPLNLEEVLDWTTAVLNRVDRAEFFSRFADGEAVQYFYEPFLTGKVSARTRQGFVSRLYKCGAGGRTASAALGNFWMSWETMVILQPCQKLQTVFLLSRCMFPHNTRNGRDWLIYVPNNQSQVIKKIVVSV
jgi:hypothetical protein